MQIVMVGQMVASVRGLSLLKAELEREERGHIVTAFFAEDGVAMEFSDQEVRSAVDEADCVVTGMCATESMADGEILAATYAKERGISYGFYADTYGVQDRAWFANLRKHASFLFVLDKEEAQDAQRIYPDTQIWAVGNPSWENFDLQGVPLCEEIREEIRNTLGVTSSDKAFLLSLGTDIVTNITVLAATADAMVIARREEFLSLVSLHPGDQNDRKIYEQMVTDSGQRIMITNRAETGFSSSIILRGVDGVVDCGSSIGDEAGHLRLPVTIFQNSVLAGQLARVTSSSEWKPCTRGAISLCRYPTELAEVMLRMAEGLDASQRKAQELLYPFIPERGSTARRMADHLEGLTISHN